MGSNLFLKYGDMFSVWHTLWGKTPNILTWVAASVQTLKSVNLDQSGLK